MLVLVHAHRGGLAARRLDHYDLLGEITGGAGARGALLRAQCERVLVGARDLILLRHVLGGLRHRVHAVLPLDQRVDEAPAERGVANFGTALERLLRLGHHERRARHRFDAAGNGEIDLAAFDGARGVADRIETGGAEPIYCEAGNRVGQSGNEQRHARDVAVVLARLVGAAEHDLVERRPIHVRMALDQRPDRRGGEIVGAHLGERAAVAADRGAHRIAEEDVADLGHDGDG